VIDDENRSSHAAVARLGRPRQAFDRDWQPVFQFGYQHVTLLGQHQLLGHVPLADLGHVEHGSVSS
jgi:hypothetical protein